MKHTVSTRNIMRTFFFKTVLYDIVRIEMLCVCIISRELSLPNCGRYGVRRRHWIVRTIFFTKFSPATVIILS